MARIAKVLSLVALLAIVCGPAGASAQVFQAHELTDAPVIKSTAQAQRVILRSYPAQLRNNSIGGKVQVRFVVQADGRVDPASVEVVASTVAALGKAAERAVADIEFRPGKKDGTPVASLVVMPIAYGVS